MTRVIVLGGGDSDEREVSIRSSQAVLQAFKDLKKYHVEFCDPSVDQTYLQATHDDIIMPILHGKFGEDGEVQRLLEERKIPFLGSSSDSSKICFDKWSTREILTRHNIAMPKADLINQDQYRLHQLSKAPHVLKITNGGSSIGTHIIRQAEPLNDITNIFNDNQIIIEQLIEGCEITVSVLDNRALPAVEIQPPDGAEFDYDNKYNGRTSELCPPVSINQQLHSKVRELAEKVHKLTGARHLSRVDIMIDDQGAMFVLEINTMPGLTDQSLYPKSAKQAGMSMPMLVDEFTKLVARDYSLDLTS